MGVPVRSALGLPRGGRRSGQGMAMAKVSWWDLRLGTWAGASCACLGLVLALVADGRHHRAVLRCVRHELSSSKLNEDTDCILSRNPRGIDRLWQKGHRSSFEISSASLELEMRHPLWGHRNKVVKRSYNSTNFQLATELEGMRAQLLGMATDFESDRRRIPPIRKNALSASVIVFDELGQSRVLHRFDEPERAARALRAVQSYLASAEVGPVSLALRYDDSASDELLVFLCIAALFYFTCILPAKETVSIAKICRLQRKNILGFTLLDFHCIADHVAAFHVNEHRDSYTGEPVFSLRLVLSPDFSFSQTPQHPQASTSTPPPGHLISSSPQTTNICSPCLDIDLSFGDKFSDSAQLRRLAEAANAALLDLDQDAFPSSHHHHSSSSLSRAASHRDSFKPHASGTDNFHHYASPPHGADQPLVCAVCRSRPRDTVLFPCRHLHVCRACASCLSNCPICRTPIEERHLIFL